VIGAGGLGSPVAIGLAQAGLVVRLCDDDVVAASNLQRQLLYRPADVGQPKVQAAARRIAELGGVVEPVRERFTAASAARLMDGVVLVLDGCDDAATRFLASDACVLAGVPLIHGAALRFTGQVMTVVPRAGACLRCVFVGPPGDGPTCATSGVLGAVCGVAGALMVDRALRVLAGAPLLDEVTVYDALAGRARSVQVRRDPACPACGDVPQLGTLGAA
jgi:molybdopterin/thiamine biosynthesis adenylyltransferase